MSTNSKLLLIVKHIEIWRHLVHDCWL